MSQIGAIRDRSTLGRTAGQMARLYQQPTDVDRHLRDDHCLISGLGVRVRWTDCRISWTKLEQTDFPTDCSIHMYHSSTRWERGRSAKILPSWAVQGPIDVKRRCINDTLLEVDKVRSRDRPIDFDFALENRFHFWQF